MRTVKAIFSILLLLCAITARSSVVYVSSSIGDDRNSGLTINTPIKNIKTAIGMADTILLKCGDVFYEHVSLNGNYLSCYGQGKKPVLSGYKRVKTARWQRAGNNIWKISLNDIGFEGFRVGESSLLNNIGCIHEYDIDSIHGRKVQNRGLLKENWDFWQTEHYSRKDTKPEDFDTLYLYLHTNPNDLKLEFSVGTTGVSMRNSTVSDVRIEGFGCHGIAGKSNSVIKNCEIDGIGGMTQIGFQYFVSLGNGVEFYVSENIEDCVVEQCKISRCYDCGVTIQGGRCGQATPHNIAIRKSVIYDCCQGWEDFLNNDDNVVYQNCVFEDNIVLNSGKTGGFGYPTRFKYCHVLGNSLKGYKGMIIRNNTFVGGNYYVGGITPIQYKSNIWLGNVCYIKRGDFILSNYVGTADVVRIPKEKGVFKSLKVATNEAIFKYREMTNDMTTRFIIEDERKINKRIARLKKKYL